MSEQTNTGTGTVEGKGQEAFEAITTQADLDKIIGARLDRERKKYAGFEDFKAKAEKYDAIEEGQKTDLQKLQERIERAEKENAAFKQREQVNTWAAEVSKETGVPANLLRGSTKDELESHAAMLKEFTGEQSTAPVVQSDGKKPKSKAGVTTAELFEEATKDWF
ncbi:capsid assembly scaffolding protein Gp46 family protein [Eubacterium sp.]|uniref:capsid assembly scaffolding protein Gp46 family protein n=1 Tax=Eubacterium sp. TaxID=142586 RepID=UPI002FC8F57D